MGLMLCWRQSPGACWTQPQQPLRHVVASLTHADRRAANVSIPCSAEKKKKDLDQWGTMVNKVSLVLGAVCPITAVWSR